MKRTVLFSLCSFGLMLHVSLAQDAAKKPAPGPRTVARNLDNPSGIVIHPETGHMFVATHKGVLRLFKEDPEKGKLSRKMEIGRYPSDVYGKGPMYDIGPLGVTFLDNEHLVVCDGSRPDVEEVIRVYKVGATPPEKPQSEKKAVYTLGPIVPGPNSEKGEGNFYGVCVTKGGIFSTANGDDTKGWIVRSAITDGKPGTLETYIATKEAVGVDAPVAITANADGDLVVGQMGEISELGDGLVSIYDPATGKLKKNYKTGLSDITGLAYSPQGDLFAVDFSWADTSKGGLFKLTMTGDECTATKLFSLDKPTSIAFDADGHAYVTVFGTAEEGAKGSPGQVVKISKRLLK